MILYGPKGGQGSKRKLIDRMGRHDECWKRRLICLTITISRTLRHHAVYDSRLSAPSWAPDRTYRYRQYRRREDWDSIVV